MIALPYNAKFDFFFENLGMKKSENENLRMKNSENEKSENNYNLVR